MKTYSGYITELQDNQIFVFGSNTQGKHGAGTARLCLNKYGAKWGQASGLQGKSYGLVTTDLTKSHRPSVSKEFILNEIDRLYKFAIKHPNLEFLIAYTAEGYNLCGYTSKELAKLFNSFVIPNNIIFQDEFKDLMYENK